MGKLCGKLLKARSSAKTAEAALSALALRLKRKAPGSFRKILNTLGLKDNTMRKMLHQSTRHRETLRQIRNEVSRGSWIVQLAYSFFANLDAIFADNPKTYH